MVSLSHSRVSLYFYLGLYYGTQIYYRYLLFPPPTQAQGMCVVCGGSVRYTTFIFCQLDSCQLLAVFNSHIVAKNKDSYSLPWDMNW